MTNDSPKPTPPVQGQQPAAGQPAHAPSGAHIVRVESFYPLPITVRIEVREKTPTEALVRLGIEYRQAVAYLLALAEAEGREVEL